MSYENLNLDPADKVFLEDPDPLRGVWLKDGETNLANIIDAYYDAASSLIEMAISQGRRGERFFFPICYLYRQYLELSLKHLISLGGQIQGLQSSELRTHNLSDLWRLCRPMIEYVFPNDDKSQVESLERCILEFQLIDPLSTTFRYAEEAQKLTEIHKLNNVSLGNLQDVMRRVALLLNGCDGGFGEALSWTRESP